MVVGIVIGSGVFFKAPKVLIAAGSNVSVALAAWVIGAVSMVFGALVFADCASKVENANGLVDYAEEYVSETFGALVGWFFAVMYYPALAAVLAWASGMYTSLLYENESILWPATIFYAALAAALNYFSPKLSGTFQVSTTVIKLVPLVVISVMGIFLGLRNGVTVENFKVATTALDQGSQGFGKAVLATAFAYEGWVVATTINNEIIDAKVNLKKALIYGSLFIFVIYVTYFLGIVGILPVSEVISEGNGAINRAANVVFGSFGATLLTIVVIISCLGTLNGCMIGSTRGLYGLAVRNRGPKPELFSRLNPKTLISNASAVFAFVLIGFYLVVWYGSFNGWWGQFLDISELPITLIYGIYIVIYCFYMKKSTDENFTKRFLIPTIALLGGLVVVSGGLLKSSIVLDLAISIVVFSSGFLFIGKKEVKH